MPPMDEWEKTAGKLEGLGLVGERPAEAPVFAFRPGYAMSTNWGYKRTQAEAEEESWWGWWRGRGLIAWEVRSLELSGLPEEERKRLGLPEPAPGLLYHVDPRRASVFMGRLVFPWEALVGADGVLRSGYAAASGWRYDMTAAAYQSESWYEWWKSNGRIVWEIQSLKVSGLSDVDRALLGLPEPALGVDYLVERLPTFIVGRRLCFPTSAICGHLKRDPS